MASRTKTTETDVITSSVAVRGRSGRYWYAVLNLFPFIFWPTLAVGGIVCSLIMPWLTGVTSR
ncbi:hypothetical protein Pan216_20220 [Planctomycetes bacterium Pan216]|uniref:Uncharacterized protein n=1 Tax=Kolteria novifilia TaxID=2527975 RepID=A0A518B2G1_9BACT|nr:hypothetical protein Pan216_20220 [Planctomycetes bacterium Pan216]